MDDDAILEKEDLVRGAHARAVIRLHPCRLRRAASWRWWAPWRTELICRLCVMTWPCPSIRQAHKALDGAR